MFKSMISNIAGVFSCLFNACHLERYQFVVHMTLPVSHTLLYVYIIGIRHFIFNIEIYIYIYIIFFRRLKDLFL